MPNLNLDLNKQCMLFLLGLFDKGFLYNRMQSNVSLKPLLKLTL